MNELAEYTTQAVSAEEIDRKSTRLNSSHDQISYAVFCLKKKKKEKRAKPVYAAELQKGPPETEFAHRILHRQEDSMKLRYELRQLDTLHLHYVNTTTVRH